MKKLAFVSGAKGGTGKTTLTVNAAVLLAYLWRDRAKYPVALLDLTPRIGTAAMLLAGDPAAIANAPSLADYFSGKLTDPLYAFYLRRWQTDRGDFQVVFAFTTSDQFSRRQLELVLRALEARLSPMVALLDMPPLTSAASVAGLLDYVVPVVTPDPSAIETTRAYLSLLGGKALRPVLNLHTPEWLDPVKMSPWEETVGAALGERPHVIPYDRLFQASRQAMEVESLKLRIDESPALRALVDYVRYLEAQLSA